MSIWSEAILDVLGHANLSSEALGRLSGVPLPRLEAICAGDMPRGQELDAIACVFGVEGVDLVSGGVVAQKAPLLFRALPELYGAGSVDALGQAEEARTLGAFRRATQRLGALEARRGEGGPTLASLGLAAEEAALATAAERGRALATLVRGRLDLDAEAPIPSMRALLTGRLGVAIFAVLDDEGDDLLPGIDAACTSLPRPAILLNLGGGSPWWRVRTTLAHELCHLLFDERALSRLPYLLSPRHRSRRAKVQRIERFPAATAELRAMEKRARAFAAALLAPPEGVRACLRGLDDPTSEDAIARVIGTFGVGREVAVNQITNFVLNAQDSRRDAMLARRTSRPSMPDWPEDTIPPSACLPAGPLQDAALSAFAAGQIGSVRVRQLLDLQPTDWLPDAAGLSEAQRRPLHSREDVVRRVVLNHLAHHHAARALVLGPVERRDDVWTIPLLEASTGLPQGHATLPDGDLEAPPVVVLGAPGG